MEEAFVDCVYNTLIGVLDDAYCIPDVKNEFATGMPCEKMYEYGAKFGLQEKPPADTIL